MSVFVIAEAGVNHNGDIGTAKELIDAAADAGSDAVKFQTFKAERIVTGSSDKAEYQKIHTGHHESQYEMLKKLELSEDDHRELFTHCRDKGILFMSTPFDEESADFLHALGMNTFKISSGDITNKPFLQHVASKKLPIILSTGMSYMDEVKKAVHWINSVWDSLEVRPLLSLLHCTSAYPADFSHVNLRAMHTMHEEFGLPVGYSDHTMGIEASVAAVALGATIIEKHFTLDRTMNGPDHKASLEPHELIQLNRAIRNIEQALGSGRKEPAPEEEDTRLSARKSIVSIRTIKAHASITAGDIAVKRPGTGISPEYIEEIIGKKAARAIQRDTVLQWKDIKDA